MIPIYLGNSAHDLRHLLGADKDIELLRKPRLGGQTAANTNMESDLRLADSDGRDSHVVDLRLVAVMRAPCDGHLVLARQVGEILIAEEVLGGFIDNCAAV